MEGNTGPPLYSLRLSDSIDSICSDADFDRFAIIQRNKREVSRSGISLAIIDIIREEKLVVSSVSSYKITGASQASPCSVAWSPVENNLLASSTPQGNILTWNANGSIIGEFQCTKVYTVLKFHNFDRDLLAAGSTDSSLSLYDVRHTRVKPAIVFSGNHQSVKDLDLGRHYDTSHQLISVGDGGNVKFWDLRLPRQPFREMPAHNGQISTVAFSRRQRHIIATGGRDKFIRIWDIARYDGSLYSIETPNPVGKFAWTNESNCHICNYSANTSTFEDADCGLYYWDFRRPYIPYKHFQTHDLPITGLIFPDDPSKEIFISCDTGGTVILHDTSSATIPMYSINHVDICCAPTADECVVALPEYEDDLEPKEVIHSLDFAGKVKSQVVIAPTGCVDSQAFKDLAKGYKFVCPEGESLEYLCRHNANVAVKVGDDTIARSWALLGLLASNDPISAHRPALGYQIRPKAEHPAFDFSILNRPEEAAQRDVERLSEEETIEVTEPSRDFCADFDLYEFSNIMEEGDSEHLSYSRLETNHLKRNRFVPRMEIVENNDWFNTEDIDEMEPPRVIKPKKIHRFYGGTRHRLAGIRFGNTKDGQITKKMCVSSLIDGRILVSRVLEDPKGIRDDYKLIKDTLEERTQKRKIKFESTKKGNTKVSISKAEKEKIRKRNLEAKIREENLQWIEDNKILNGSRMPITEIHRLIIQRSKKYYDKYAKIEQEEDNADANISDSDDTDYGDLDLPEEDHWKMIKLLFDYYMTMDNIQMVSCMALCIGEKVTMLIPEKIVDRWFHFYLDLLEEHGLFKEATYFMKACYRVSITQRNTEDLFVNNVCIECNAQLMGPVCNSCSTEHFCIICESLVYGSWVFCIECGHGGHPEHIREWFEQHDTCPAPFCEHGCFPIKRDYGNKRKKTRSGSPAATYGKLNRDDRSTLRSNFWRYKVPPIKK